MAKLKVGDKAPELNITASNGQNVTLSDFKGKNIVLYFYPKDDTPGCTVEACAFRDNIKNVDKADAVVLGISPDNLNSHQKFITKFSLPFLLLSDMDKKVAEAYGVWVEKSMYGRKYMGVNRSTFLIDKEGKIAKIFEKVTPKGHDEEVLAALGALK